LTLLSHDLVNDPIRSKLSSAVDTAKSDVVLLLTLLSQINGISIRLSSFSDTNESVMTLLIQFYKFYQDLIFFQVKITKSKPGLSISPKAFQAKGYKKDN
jgi:hypothetical protein